MKTINIKKHAEHRMTNKVITNDLSANISLTADELKTVVGGGIISGSSHKAVGNLPIHE